MLQYMYAKEAVMTQYVEVVHRIPVPELPELDLPEEDGVPMESDWHRSQMNALIDVVRYHWRERKDVFVGGNMFIYYSFRQARNQDFKGPDFFFVKGIESNHQRGKWVVWEEDARYPNVIIELMSPSTADEDLGRKKKVYETIFHTPNYFCYDPDSEMLYGWHLNGAGYAPLQPNERGWLWCEEFEAWLGLWDGVVYQTEGRWLRFFSPDGALIPMESEAERERAETERERAETERERAETERERAETERERAEAAEAEIARLRAELARLQGRLEQGATE
jgi:Uma2 family endonuclease